jgi:site-specific recombinase XerD
MIVRHRLMGIGIVGGRRGPHALRHGAAQHLMDQGTPMKVIGDFLGHREPSSTAVYAKVNLAALREVAALDLEGLV